MRVSAIHYQSKPVFTGESSTKNKIRNAAGAAAIALAAMSPSAEADAQFPIYPNYTYVSTRLKVPRSFVLGDTSYPIADKSREKIFSEIDKNNNGVLSAREVVNTDIKNWNRNNPMLATASMAAQWQQLFRQVSYEYNQDNSNPNTINLEEYNAIMDDYDEQNANTFIIPIVPYPYYIAPPPPPPHHHHPRHHHHRH